MIHLRFAPTRARYVVSLLNPDLASGYIRLPRTNADVGVDRPLNAAIQWICRAQDASNDAGVSRSYSLAFDPHYRRRGWMPSYPETTGYIIPTLFDYAARAHSDELFGRALRMADWECRVQMPSGAVQGGTVEAPPSPAIFNTGQVIFGWVRAYQETGHERYLAAAMRAGDFLIAQQDGDGAWRKSLSRYASDRMPSYTYNTRTAWALALLGDATQRGAYTEAAIWNIEFALGEQLPNGWFRNNCLEHPDRPLLHTIAYALRGVLEVGIALENPSYVAAAQRGADAVLERQQPDGSLAARFDADWSPAAHYSCLTGNAQMGTIWARLHQVTGEERYLAALKKVNHFLKRVQWLGTGNPGLDGGISGSHPLHGRYGRFEVLNWAVKFFADSLMFEAAAAPSAAASRV